MSLHISSCPARSIWWRRYPISRLILSIVSLIMLWGPGAASALGQQTVRLEGRVRSDAGETPHSTVKLRLETDEGRLVSEQTANSEGSYQFYDLAKIGYRLTVSAEGFETYEETFDLGYSGNVAIQNISLRPARKLVDKQSPTETRTENVAPKNAKKEYERATGDLLAKNLDSAQAHLENAVKEYPCYARAQTDLATILQVRRDLRAAEAALKKARECDPDYIDSYIILGQMFNTQRRFADSAQVLQDGLRRSPHSWQFYYQLGVAQAGLGHYSEAEAQYTRVLELNPSPPTEFRVKLADVYLKEKAYRKAYAQMEQYLKADPNGRFADKVTGIMRQMKDSGVLGQPVAEKP